MFHKFIEFQNFLIKKKNNNIKKFFVSLINDYKNNDQLLKSLSHSYKYSFNKKILSKYKNNKNFKIIGMGGSNLGAEAIYNFLKCKKNFYFINNLQNSTKSIENRSSTNIIISKWNKILYKVL